MALPASELLASSWTSAADGYDELFVPRFAPWTRDALAALTAHVASLPPGGAMVPCCGPGQELPALAEMLGTERTIIGIDLAPGMIAIAKRRANACGAHVSAIVGDAMQPPPGPHAVVLSVFGLQQVPDPVAALSAWVGSLAPGGVAVVCFWPGTVEDDGPWARWGSLLKSKVGSSKRGPEGWEAALALAAEAVGGEVLEDCLIAHEISWDNPAAFWEGMTRAGPWHAQRLRHSDDFVDGLKEEFCEAYASDEVVAHSPNARMLVVRQTGSAAAGL
jgi:SAM-dependent methyltransferase